MTTMDEDTEILATVQRAVRRQVAGAASGAGTAALDPDTSLTALGVTSLVTVRLMVELEAECGVEFPADAITPETFRTVRTLAETVRSLRAEAGR
jgi:acyl carrier protein